MRHDRRLDSRPRQIAPAPRPARPAVRRWGAPLFIAVVTFVAFLPSLTDGFVAWDDDKNFLNNPHYRGLGPTQLHWMWTTFHLGHYVPLTWMSLGLDYTLWGMNPAGYHLTSLMIHTVNAVLVYWLARRLLPLCVDGLDERTTTRAAVLAALIFSIHPLRVESVTWITERRDVLSGFFYLATLLCYIRAARGGERRTRWFAAAILLFICALLSKATALSLPATLLVLDVYPLRRLGGDRGWRGAEARRVYREVAPFALLSAGAAVLSIVALHPPTQLVPFQKLAVSAYGLWFYIWKTALPLALSPLYELPRRVDPAAPRFLAAYVVVIALVVAVWRARVRWPGITAAAIAFLVAILPMLGAVQNGPQLVADRYTYFAAPAVALLVGALAVRVAPRRAIGTWVVAAACAMLAVMTWRQTEVWHDPQSLWTRVLSLDDSSSIAHVGMSTLLLRENRLSEAAEHARKAIDLAPDYAEARNDLGVVYARIGKPDSAITEYEEAIMLAPHDEEAHSNLGALLSQRGDLAGAVAQYAEALALNPDAADTHVNWGNALVRAGQPGQAVPHYREALFIRPTDADAELNWGVALAVERRFGEAADHFRRALALDPGSQQARAYLARATELSRGGR